MEGEFWGGYSRLINHEIIVLASEELLRTNLRSAVMEVKRQNRNGLICWLASH